MALYNNGFPVTYPQMYYQPPYQPQAQYQQPVPQPVPQQQPTAPHVTNSLIWVQGEAGAKSHFVAPNTTVPLWDSEAQKIYLKSADAAGMPTMKILNYTIEETPNITAPIQKAVNGAVMAQDDSKKFISPEAETALKRQIEGFRNDLEAIKGEMESFKNDLYGIAGKKAVPARKKESGDD